MAGSPGDVWSTTLPLPRGTGPVCSWLPAGLWDLLIYLRKMIFVSCACMSPGSCSDIWFRGVKPLDRAWPEWRCFSGATEAGGGARNMNSVTPWAPFFSCASPKYVWSISEEAETRQRRTPLRCLPLWFGSRKNEKGIRNPSALLLKSPTMLLYKRHHQRLLVHLACNSGGTCVFPHFEKWKCSDIFLWFVGVFCFVFFPFGPSVTAYVDVTTNSWDYIFQKGIQVMWRSKGGILSSLLQKTQLQNLRKASFIYIHPKHHFLAHKLAKKP